MVSVAPVDGAIDLLGGLAGIDLTPVDLGQIKGGGLTSFFEIDLGPVDIFEAFSSWLE